MSSPPLASDMLREVLSHELAAGNAVARSETRWSKMDVVVRMRHPLDERFLQSVARKDPACRVYGVDDPHQGPPEFGIACGREAVSGPAH